MIVDQKKGLRDIWLGHFQLPFRSKTLPYVANQDSSAVVTERLGFRSWFCHHLSDVGQVTWPCSPLASGRFLWCVAGLGTTPEQRKCLVPGYHCFYYILRALSFWEYTQKVFLAPRILSSKTMTEYNKGGCENLEAKTDQIVLFSFLL